MNTFFYKIGQVYIEIQKPEAMPVPQNMQKFQIEEVPADASVQMTYIVEYIDDIEKKEAELVAKKVSGVEAKRENLYVFQTEMGECRRINFVGDVLPYALTLRESNSLTKIWFRRYYAEMLIYDTIFNSTLALEKQMIEEGALILHSAYMNYKDTAVLFSAPSETGKSTQAYLWEKYRGTYTVNGDRALLIREVDGWYAYGWPICGSSEICHNEKYPVRCIVMLKQAKENKAYPIKGFQAVREVMEQITINAWDREFQMKAMDQLEQLLAEVPVYKLECDISEEAVYCLEELIG